MANGFVTMIVGGVILGVSALYLSNSTPSSEMETAIQGEPLKFAKSCKSDMKKHGKAFHSFASLDDACLCVAQTAGQTLESPDWTLLSELYGQVIASKASYRAMQSSVSNLSDSEWTPLLDSKSALLFAVSHCVKTKTVEKEAVKKTKSEEPGRGYVSPKEACAKHTKEHFDKIDEVLAKRGKKVNRETCQSYKI